MAALLKGAEYGPRCADVVFVTLHGLLGSKRNWHSIARGLTETPQSFLSTQLELKRARVVALDVRNHGESFWAAPHSLETIADDVALSIDQVRQQSPSARIVCAGHSMGGVAMAYGVSRRDNRIQCDALCLVDCAPAPRPKSFRDLAAAVRAMHEMQVSDLTSRKQVIDRLRSTLPSLWRQTPLLQYFSSNIETNATGGRWTSNIEELVKSLDDDALLWESFSSRTNSIALPTHACFAEDSSYCTPEALAGVRRTFPSATIENVPTGGHFHSVHHPEQYLRTLVPWLHRQDLL